MLSFTDNVKEVMSTLAYDMMTFYHGNESGQTPGILPGQLSRILKLLKCILTYEGPCASTACY